MTSQLRQQPAQLFAQVQIGFDQRVGLRVQVGEIDRVAHGAVDQIIDDSLGHFDADIFLRLLRAGAQMRRHDHLRQVAQGTFLRQRLRLVHVQRRAGDVAAPDGVE